jgi:PHD/YefM family antitoxin component YafN of YafNO toxin-antitoxin module
MINIAQLRLILAEDGVQATSIARAELTTRVAEFKDLGPDARPIVFGSHRKPQAVVLPYDLFTELLDAAEGVQHIPKAAAPAGRTSRKVAKGSKKRNLTESEQIVQDLPELEKEHIGQSTQELLDQIMAKWKL